MKNTMTGTFLQWIVCFLSVHTFQCSVGYANSSTFQTIIFNTGDYKPRIPNADLSSDGDWLIYNGVNWITALSAPENLVPAARPQRIFIDLPGITAGNHTATSYNDFIIMAGGELIFTIDAPLPLSSPFLNTGKSIEVQSGGKCYVRGDLALPSDGWMTLRSGSELILDQNSIGNTHPLWDGIECFETGSTVVVRNWNWNSALLGSNLQISVNANGYCFGHLSIEASPTAHWNLIDAVSGMVLLTEGDLLIRNTSAYFIIGTTATGGLSGFVVHGNCMISDGAFAFGASTSAVFLQHRFLVGGSFTCLSDDVLKTHWNAGAVASDLDGSVTFQGNVSIASGVSFFGSDASAAGTRISVLLEGGTAAAPLYLQVAPVITGIQVYVRSGSFVQLQGQSLTLNSLTGITSRFVVESGASFHFGWAMDGLTPLMVRRIASGATGTSQFVAQAGAELLITSPDGLQQASATSGNVQLTTANKSFSQTAIFHYVGRQDQQTGDAITAVGSARILICELQTNVLKLTLTNSTSITAPGSLDIRSGQFLESTTAYITGSTGGLTMSAGTLYQIPSLSSNATDYIPRMTGIANAYALSGGTIELSGNGLQILRGSRNYRNLIFSQSGTKTISSAITDINGTVSILHSVTLNVFNYTMGGVGTHLLMSGSSRYTTAGTGTKPDAQESYSLGTGTTIEFTNTLSTRQDIRLAPMYANIEVSGSNVANGSLVSTPIYMQSGTVFRIKNGGVFKFLNQNGFCDGSATAISSVNNPVIQLENGSTVDYAGTASCTLTSRSDYKNITISGGGSFALNGPVVMSGVLRLQSGFIHTTATGSLTLTASATCPAGGSISSFVNGPLIKEGTADFIFPIGKYTASQQQYAPVAISSLTAPTVFTAQFYKGNAHWIGALQAPGLQRVSYCEYWSLVPISTVQAHVTLNWSASSNCNTGSYVTDLSSLVVAHSNGQALVNNSGAWEDFGMNSVSGSLSAGNLTRHSVTQFGLFSLGTTSVDQNPLPHEPAILQGFSMKSGIQLKGILYACSDATLLQLERSRNGVQFFKFNPKVLFPETGACRFVVMDSFPQPGPNYYRARWKAGDQMVYSNVVCVYLQQPVPIVLQNLPTGQQVLIKEIREKEIRRIRILNQMGQVLKEIVPDKDTVVMSLQSFLSGMYWVQVLTPYGSFVHPVWKQ